MSRKVKYEARTYCHDHSPPDDSEAAFLALNPLEQICSDLGGIRVDQAVEENDDGYTVSLTYIVAKRNGVAAVVKMEIVDASNGDCEDCIRQTIVSNVKEYEHKELLTALDAFYSGKPGLERTKLRVVEGEIKSKIILFFHHLANIFVLSFVTFSIFY